MLMATFASAHSRQGPDVLMSRTILLLLLASSLSGCLGHSITIPARPAAALAPLEEFDLNCEGYERWYPIDVASLQSVLPHGYAPAMQPTEVTYAPLAPTHQQAARVELASASCDVDFGNQHKIANLAWTAILVTDGPTPMRTTRSDYNQYVLEAFGDGLPSPMVDLLRRHAWPLQNATITQGPTTTRIEVAGKAVYQATASPETSIATDNAFGGERWHHVANETGTWWDINGRVDRYDPESVSTLQTAAGILGTFTEAGLKGPFVGWSTGIALSGTSRFGHTYAALPAGATN